MSVQITEEYNKHKAECEQMGISLNCFYQRVCINHWTVEKAISTPVRAYTTKNMSKPIQTNENKRISSATNRGTTTESFKPITNYPAQEYRRWCECKILELYDSMQKMIEINEERRLDSAIETIQNEINRYRDEIETTKSFWYAAVDIYVVHPTKAEKLQGKKVLQEIMMTLKTAQGNPDSLVYKIYYEFARKYNIKTYFRQDCEQEEELLEN